MKIEVYIPVSVIVDTETGDREIGEIGSVSWPHRACPEIWNHERDTWEEAVDWPAVTEGANEYLTERIRFGG